MLPKFIDHIVLIVKNIEETEGFYSSFLGKPDHQDENQVAYKIGETKVFFGLPFGDYEKSDKDKTSLNHLAFGVRSTKELKEFEKILNDAGIKNSGVLIDKYGNKEFIWFDDPNGYRLEFYCRPLEKEIPQIIKDVGFDFHWSEEKVWALDIPIEEMDINELTWHFDIPFLWEDGVYNLKPQDVIDNESSHKKEYERTMRADLIHPIDIMQNKGRWLILDGLHRLMKASIQNMKTVQVRKVPRELIPKIEK